MFSVGSLNLGWGFTEGLLLPIVVTVTVRRNDLRFRVLDLSLDLKVCSGRGLYDLAPSTHVAPTNGDHKR